MIVALGSDFNPNAYCLAMPVVMHLGCVNLRMSLAESLAAATINSAHSLGRSETHGSIEVTRENNFHFAIETSNNFRLGKLLIF